MAAFHRHHCWLLYLDIFLWFIPNDKCNHMLGYMITLEVLFWRDYIISILYISLSPLSDGLCGITFLESFIPVQWCRITIASVYFCFCLICLFPPCLRVWTLVMITDCKASSLLSDHIIAIYQHFIYDPCWIKISVSHFIVNILLSNGANILYCCTEQQTDTGNSHREHGCLQVHLHGLPWNYVNGHTYTRKYKQVFLWKHLHGIFCKWVHGRHGHGILHKRVHGYLYW